MATQVVYGADPNSPQTTQSVHSPSNASSVNSQPPSITSPQPTIIYANVEMASGQPGQPGTDDAVNVDIDNETEEKPPNKWLELFWCIWHTSDFITDLILGIEWCHGIETTQQEASKACTYDENTILKVCGVILLVCSTLGYGLYLYSAYKLNIKGITPTGAWAKTKIMKLFCEDFISVIITAFVSAGLFGITVLSAVSLLMSAISFLVFIIKLAVMDPWKKSEVYWDKCCAIFCCILWLMALGSVIGMLYLVIWSTGNEDNVATGEIKETGNEKKVISVGEFCYSFSQGERQFGTYETDPDWIYTRSFVQNDIVCYYNVNDEEGIQCTWNSEYDSWSPDMTNETTNVTKVYYKSCNQVPYWAGNVIRTETVCFDEIQISTKIDLALVAGFGF